MPVAQKPRKKYTRKKDKPEAEVLTLDGILNSTLQNTENSKAVYFKQLGVQEFLQSLKAEGYELTKVE